MKFEPRFGPAAAAYHVFRPAYPTALFERILAAVPPQHRSCAMDLGAGTGQSTLPLCSWFAKVIAVEPDSQMAARLAGQHPRIAVRMTTAEECSQPPASVDLAACGTAFYWMDGPRVLANVLSWLRPEGALAVYRYRFPQAPPVVQAVLEEELRLHWERFRHDRLRDQDFSRRTVTAAPGFRVDAALEIRNQVLLSVRKLAGFCSSTSYASAYLRTLAEPHAYLRDLESCFHRAHPDDMIPVDFHVELIPARKA